MTNLSDHGGVRALTSGDSGIRALQRGSHETVQCNTYEMVKAACSTIIMQDTGLKIPEIC